MRTKTLAALVVALALLAMTPSLADARSVYCSPTGDYCESAVREGSDVILQMKTFSFTGVIEVCVSKRSTVCRTSRMRRSKGIYVSRVSWKRRFPSQGSGTYRVRWYLQGSQIGIGVSFRR